MKNIKLVVLEFNPEYFSISKEKRKEIMIKIIMEREAIKPSRGPFLVKTYL